MKINHSPPEISFDQNERITDRLQDIVRNYPKGLGLFKEFLQNADDAGASKLQIIYDHRHHTGALENSEITPALAPSLLFVNDQIFTDDDFERIQNIGNGGKVRDSNRTGRFGLGFNTCFSVSDHPSLLTADKVAWFDPHQRVFPKGKNARAWSVPVAEEYFPDWVKTFTAAGLKPGSGYFSGTAFRLPLRTSADAVISEICDEPFTHEDFISILDELNQVGPPLVIFLRSINTIEVLEIAEDGAERLRYQLSTMNESEVEKNRSILRKLVDGKPEDLLENWLASDEQLPVVQYNHSFVLIGIDGIEHNETWAVTSGLFRGPNNQLLQDALKVCRHREKAIPWAGAATILSGTRTNAVSGGLACFLPLPEKVDWPIWLHGWFDLSSNRRGITRSAEVGGANHDRYEWNKSLTEHAVAKAWAMLMVQIAGDAEKNVEPYRLWPTYESPDEINYALIMGFYRVAASFPLIRGLNSEGYHWQRLKEGVLDLSQTWHNHLLEPFLAEGWSICVPPLNDSVKQGFDEAVETIPSLTPAFLRDYLLEIDSECDIACELTEAPKQMLRNKKWIYSLAKFCSGGNLNSLANLPLAILSDGLLHTYTACGTIYIDDENEHIRSLLQAVPGQLFDAEYQAAIGISKSYEKINVVEFNLGSFLKCVPEILLKGDPSNLWLCKFFDFLERRDSPEITVYADELKELEIIPDQYGNFWAMGLIETPLVTHNSEDKLLFNALTTLKIPLLEGESELIQIIERFASKHDGFIWRLTPNDIAYNLKDQAENETFDDRVLDDRDNVLFPLLDFLASEKNWLKSDDDRLPFLRQLRLLPTTSGQRINAEKPNTYMPGSFHPPQDFEGEYQLIDTGGNDQWREFFLNLDVRLLNGSAFVENALLPALSSSITKQKCYSLLVWLRDEYQLVARGLSESERERLHQLIRSTSILPINGGGMGAPSKVYRPNASEPKKLFGSRVRIPNKQFFSSDIDLWNKFFNEFRLPLKPLAPDVVIEVSRLVDISRENGIPAVRAQLKNLIAHISDNWSDLADIKCDDNKTFAARLAEIDWLPVVPTEAAKFAAYYSGWQHTLWRPDQVIPPRLANLASSKYPVLDSQEFSEEMAKALRLVTRVTFSEVTEHFEKVRNLPNPTTDVEQDMIRRSAYEVYRFIGQLSALEVALKKVDLATISEESSILVANKWQIPSRCFFSLPFSTSWAVSIVDAFPSIDQFLRVGLERLGVRQSPDPDDWLQMLNDLAEAAEYEILSPDALKQARHAIRQLRSAPLEWLEESDVLVPLASGKLHNAHLSLIPDDSRLKKLDCQNSLPLIEDNQDAMDVGRYSGARSLRAELQDRLAVPPKPIQNQDFAKKIQYRIRSREFQECLKRIAYEEAIAQNDIHPMEVVNNPIFDSPKKLEVRITSTIQIESVIDLAGEEIVAFEISDASSFLENETNYSRLWLKDRKSRRRMLDELVRTICELCQLSDQLRLSRILEKEPEEMSRVLDEDEVAIIPIGQLLDLGDNEFETDDSHEFNEELYERDTSLVDQDIQLDNNEVQDIFVSVNHGTGMEDVNENEPDLVLDLHRHSLPQFNRGAYRKFRTRSRSTNSSARGGTSDFSEQQSSDQNSPPIEPGHGSSTSWVEGVNKESSKSNQARLRSYVHEKEQSDYDTEPTESAAKDIGDAGESFVMNWEMKAARTPKKMPINNEGYDIVSESPEGLRYIEVKSIDGSWGARGVGVTRAQYDTAIKFGPNWWLYIVEHARDGTRSVVTPIQNPFHQATEFRFDAGWRDFHSVPFHILQAQPNSKPEVGAQYERNNSIVTILEAFQRGLLWKVKIKLADDSTTTVPWNPSWRRL